MSSSSSPLLLSIFRSDEHDEKGGEMTDSVFGPVQKVEDLRLSHSGEGVTQLSTAGRCLGMVEMVADRDLVVSAAAGRCIS